MRVERGRRYELRHNTNATALICAAGLLFPACLDRSTVSRCVCSVQTSLNCAAVAARKKHLGFLGSNFKGRAGHCQQYSVFLFHSFHLPVHLAKAP